MRADDGSDGKPDAVTTPSERQLKAKMLRLKALLARAVACRDADALLLSGGLDSSIIAALSPGLKAFTVTMKPYGSDAEYASHLAEALRMRHYHMSFSADDAVTAIPEVVRILKTFDPALPNDIAIYIALKNAKAHGIGTILTGDGSDELFAGYSYMQELKDLNGYVAKLASTMTFASAELAQSLDLKLHQPYLDAELIEFAVELPSALKVRSENGKIWGKWILRKAFERELPSQIVWRVKTPIEQGSGASGIGAVITSGISEREFSRKQRRYNIKFLNKAHLFYYETYRAVVGEIPTPKASEKACRFCGAGVAHGRTHCRVCGGYPT